MSLVLLGDRMISWSLEAHGHARCLTRWVVAALFVDTATAESRLQSNRHPNGLAAPPDHREDILSPDRPVQLFLRRIRPTRTIRENIRAATVREPAIDSRAESILPSHSQNL